jgi:hypothetical protein
MEVVNTTSTTEPANMYNYLNNIILNPIIIIIIILVIAGYYFFSLSLGNENYSGNEITYESSTKIIGIIIVIVLFLLVINNVFEYFFNVNVTAYVKGLFSPNKQIDVVVQNNTVQSYQPSTVPEIKYKKQVFNIPGNYYNYENAEALCQAYGSKLATYEQIEKAYNAGSEWCNYGWSAGQMALFPTQLNTYNNLQNIEGHQQDCGRPGINGGYMSNPKIKFGVNCYGYKPKITQEEDEMMKTTPPYPVTMEDIAFQKRVDFWKTKTDEILVSPFNHDSWSAI